MSEKKLMISVAKIVHLTIFGARAKLGLEDWDRYIILLPYQIPE
ncbi:MAG: hypothetical protein QNJ27_03505 [Simkaniaceae bacterium]|nr:hypothetical protein [Simkaniaceae bacterium]